MRIWPSLALILALTGLTFTARADPPPTKLTYRPAPNATCDGYPRAPIDMVGTGSFLPATLTETYATADIISYDGVRRVKVGREFLFDGG